MKKSLTWENGPKKYVPFPIEHVCYAYPMTNTKATINLNKLAAFDLETTGLDVTQDRAVTAVVVKSNTDSNDQEYSWLINPEKPSNPAAVDVHGITDEYATENGQNITDATQEIINVLSDSWADGYTIVAYNIAFDLSMLFQQALDFGVNLPEIGPILDPLVIDRAIDKYRRGSRKLINVAAHYGVELTDDDAHDAGNDARATLQVMRAMANAPVFTKSAFGKMVNTPGMAGQVMEVQKFWADNQEKGFAQWHRHAPKLGWPVKDVVVNHAQGEAVAEGV